MASSKDILNYVNQAVQECENRQRLLDFHRRLDKRQIENSDHAVLKQYKVGHCGYTNNTRYVTVVIQGSEGTTGMSLNNV